MQSLTVTKRQIFHDNFSTNFQGSEIPHAET